VRVGVEKGDERPRPFGRAEKPDGLEADGRRLKA
jgi:hypothetical protein